MGLKVYIALLVTTCSMSSMVEAEGYKRVCYYSNWSQYRNGVGKFFPGDIDPFLCTHLIYSFAKLTSSYELGMYEWNDDRLYSEFNSLKKANPDLKTLLAVGGWNAGSVPFSDMVTNQNIRRNFARQSVEFIVQYGFDGLDMDWEYPANRGGRASDKENFILLLQDIREEMWNAGQGHLLLTAAVAAGKNTIDPAYDIAAMARHLDFINLMSYDLHGAWETFTGHNSPLYRRASESGGQEQLNIDWAADYWVRGGTPREKLIIGLATYGRHFRLADPSNNGMNAPVTGAGTQGPYTGEAGFLAYYEVCNMLATGGVSYWHDEHMVPYLVKGDQWVGYDNEKSFIIKLRYIKENNYGGAMIWNIDLDDFNQNCPLSKTNYPLTRLMVEILGDYTPTTSDPFTTDLPKSTVVTKKTDTTTKQTVPSTKQTAPPSTKNPTNPPEGYKRVCYYSNWSQYRNGVGKFFPGDIDPFLCTHLIYSFAKLTSNYELGMYEWNDDRLYSEFNSLKNANPELKTLLAVGGWNAGSVPFSDMVTNQNIRRNFARQSVEFIVQYGFDGLDMDWEYPANRGGRASDKENFILLLQDIRTAMRNAGQGHLLLTAAVAAGKKTIDPAYDIAAMAVHLDFINLMSYDLHGGWEKFTGHNSPLFSRASESGGQAQLNIDWAADYWVRGGTPREKLIIGLATYGRHFRLTNPSNNGMNAPVSGTGTQGPYTRQEGFLAYYEVCNMLATGGVSYWHDEHMVPYLVKGDQWVGYDDEESFLIKLLYIKEKNFGGAMIWNIDLDDFNQNCPLSKTNYPLTRLMRKILGDYTPTTREPFTTDLPQSTDKTDATTKQTAPPPTEGPTNPPGVFTCDGKADGHHADPFDCTKYHQCYGGRQFDYQCAPLLRWNQKLLYCDYYYNVECKQQTAPPSVSPTTQAVTTPTKSPTSKTSTVPITTEIPTETSPTTTTTSTTTTSIPTTSTTTTAEPTTMKVTESVTDPPTSDNFCANKEDGLYKNDDDCQAYFQCSHGQTHSVTCQAGLLYHAELKVCDWAAIVGCDEQDPDIEMCRGKAGLHPDPKDCSRYYNCAHGAPGLSTLNTCDEGTYYSTNHKNCMWINNVNCGDRPTPDGGVNARDSFCETTQNGIYANPDSCHDYIQCAHGIEYHSTCGTYLVFNPVWKVCDWPHNYPCMP